MDLDPLYNKNITGTESLITPHDLYLRMPLSEKGRTTVANARKIIQDILTGIDSRILLIVGPCSIHDIAAAKEYAQKLKELSKQVSKTFFVVMRAYFEKPRTIDGWQGLITDPDIDGTFDMNKGLAQAREFLLYLADEGIPAATEVLNPIVPQYFSDLISWAAIGARTTESQTHRQMASGLSMPIGFKNGTDGNIEIAVNALKSSRKPHQFVGVNAQGQVCIFKSSGNAFGHLVLRGGKDKPNYDPVSVVDIQQKLVGSGLSKRIVIDCSHDNSNKQYALQPLAWESVVDQILDGNREIVGIMLESNLSAGNQPSAANPRQYGVSITDGCIDWETTKALILDAQVKLNK